MLLLVVLIIFSQEVRDPLGEWAILLRFWRLCKYVPRICIWQEKLTGLILDRVNWSMRQCVPSASKAKLYSVLKSAKGMFASSASISASAKLEALSSTQQLAPSLLKGRQHHILSLVVIELIFSQFVRLLFKIVIAGNRLMFSRNISDAYPKH